MKTIKIDERLWRIVSQSENRIILHPAKRLGGEELRKARLKAGLSLRLAAPVLGTSVGNLCSIERGRHNCPASLLAKLPLLAMLNQM